MSRKRPLLLANVLAAQKEMCPKSRKADSPATAEGDQQTADSRQQTADTNADMTSSSKGDMAAAAAAGAGLRAEAARAGAGGAGTDAAAFAQYVGAVPRTWCLCGCCMECTLMILLILLPVNLIFSAQQQQQQQQKPLRQG